MRKVSAVGVVVGGGVEGPGPVDCGGLSSPPHPNNVNATATAVAVRQCALLIAMLSPLVFFLMLFFVTPCGMPLCCQWRKNRFATNVIVNISGPHSA
ncbi:hypothetical protein [Cupriavidus agavae]|uniref:hypothetical protein n=1 Tax=Cupriavidus agavae TaxID=1001822 RepID=UPI0013004B8F|nr:hypothetical protein [Cupriavidus agavae]